MTEPKFNNRSNDHIMYSFNSASTGVKIKQDYWISRAIAINGLVFILLPTGTHILITKRSDKMRDEPNKYCIPCGYLDWDETTYEAMIREVYEETSLYLPDYEKYLKFNNNKQPFIIRDDPKLNRQNVSLIYLSVYDFTSDIDNFPQYVENFTCEEVYRVQWISVFAFNETYQLAPWAFNHDEIIKNALIYYSRNTKI